MTEVVDPQTLLIKNKVEALDIHSHHHQDLDLTESLIAELEDGEYMCLICAGEVDARTEIWNCSHCHRVYHLPCATAWAEKSTQKNQADNNNKKSKEGWPCPACMKTTKKIPREYKCWCRKTTNPMYLGIMPHSCGQTCGVTLECGHRCTAICHPGPHPDCCSMGPAIKCFCGDNQRQLPCVMTSYNGWSCGKICNELLPCGKHKCKRRCHDGLCYDCDTKIESKCYCGQTEKELECAYLREKKCSKLITTLDDDNDDEKESVESWIGYFECEKLSTGLYSCRNHEYSFSCKPHKKEDFICPLTPKDTDTCPCGSSLVLDILGHPRLSCKEEIPLCGNVCNKLLPCGHKCLFDCHYGDCPDCPQVNKSHCRCGQEIFLVPCKTIALGEKPACHHKCTAKLQCGRHRCTEICCSEEKTAKALQKSGQAWKLTREEWPEVHRCDRVCNILKNCKIHKCTEPCHQGPCKPCMESSNEDYVCPCGQTVVRAPIRCGTVMPKCSHLCTRQRENCEHPMAEHVCHDPAVTPCPKCYYIVPKKCQCGKSTVKAPCSQPVTSCGKFCEELLPCGHMCSKMCHKPGDCIKVCSKSCGKTLPCGHKHMTAKCHFPKKCEDTAPKPGESFCSERVHMQCKCGNVTKTKQCTGRPTSLLLECNESCAVLERNRQIAAAFGMDPATAGTTGSVTSDMYSDDIIDLYLSNPAWCRSIERALQEMYTHKLRVKRFPPMRSSYERMFVHLLAQEGFNFKSESQDVDPHRSVVVYADWDTMNNEGYPRKPVMTLSEFVSRANIS